MRELRFVIGITGASGSPYARLLLQVLGKQGAHLYVVASRAGRLVYELETGGSLERDLPPGTSLYDETDFTAPFASGSFQTNGMVIVPCTMGTLGAIASGISQNLVHRAADVTLKERRPLILVTREMPLNRVHLENMLKAHDAGAVIMPPAPGFYQHPGSIEDLVRFVVARILDQLKVPHELIPPWTPPPASS